MTRPCFGWLEVGGSPPVYGEIMFLQSMNKLAFLNGPNGATETG